MVSLATLGSILALYSGKEVPSMKKIIQYLAVSLVMFPDFAAADSPETFSKGTLVQFTQEFKTLDRATNARIIKPGLGGIVLSTDQTGNPTLIRIIGCLGKNRISEFRDECEIPMGKEAPNLMKRRVSTKTALDNKGSDISALYQIDRETARRVLNAELRLMRIQVEKEKNEKLTADGESRMGAQMVEFMSKDPYYTIGLGTGNY